jgi:hypothetical protein
MKFSELILKIKKNQLPFIILDSLFKTGFCVYATYLLIETLKDNPTKINLEGLWYILRIVNLLIIVLTSGPLVQKMKFYNKIVQSEQTFERFMMDENKFLHLTSQFAHLLNLLAVHSIVPYLMNTSSSPEQLTLYSSLDMIYHSLILILQKLHFTTLNHIDLNENTRLLDETRLNL